MTDKNTLSDKIHRHPHCPYPGLKAENASSKLIPVGSLLKLSGWVAETRQYYPGVYVALNIQEDKIGTFIIPASGACLFLPYHCYTIIFG